MWHARYWAVLGFQTLLALLIVIWSLLLVQAENVLARRWSRSRSSRGAGTMFWFLVKALARIQMPDRRPPPRRSISSAAVADKYDMVVIGVGPGRLRGRDPRRAARA